jgi:hypothetical protein
MNSEPSIERKGGFVLISIGTRKPLIWYWNCGPSVLRMWICWFWSIATLGIWARIDVTGVPAPAGRASMPSALIR